MKKKNDVKKGFLNKNKNSRKDLLHSIKTGITASMNVKIICFILAVAMYFLIAVSQRNEKTFSSKVNIIGLKDYFVVSNPIPETVKVIVKDKKSTIDKITESDFNVTLNLLHIKEPDTYKVSFDWDIPKPMKSFFSSINVEPSVIEISVDQLMEKNIPIVIDFIGEVQSDFELKRKTINPNEIRIQGPKKIIDSIEFLETEKINIKGENESFIRYVSLISPNSMINIIGPDKVEVYFEIIKKTEIKTFSYTRVFVNNLKKQFRPVFDNKPIYIKILGPKNIVSSITKDDLILSIDCANIIFPGVFTQPIDVSLPDDELKLLSVTPKSLKITIEDRGNN